MLTIDDVFEQVGNPSRGSFEIVGEKILGAYEYIQPMVDLVVIFDSSTLEVLYVKNIPKYF